MTTANLQLQLMLKPKKALAAQARLIGWRGDEARATKLSLVLWLAAHQGDNHEQPQGDDSSMPAPDTQPDTRPSPDAGQQSKSPDENPWNENEGSAPSATPSNDEPEQGESQGEGEGEGSDEQGEGEGEGDDSQGEGEGDDSSMPEQSPQQPAEQQPAQGRQPQQQSQPTPSDKHESQPEQQQPAPFQSAPQFLSNKQWQQLLKAAGIERPHYLLRKVYVLCLAGQNVCLVGPAGSGKTTLAAQLAKVFQAKFGFVSCTAGMSESNLNGWLLPIQDHGKFDYVPAPLVDIVRNGGVFLWDELDRSDANAIITVNALLANGTMSLPHAVNIPSRSVARHKACYLLGACNTLQGADETYTAAVQLDGSTLDRFYALMVEYDESYEAATLGQTAPTKRQWAPRAFDLAAAKSEAYAWFKQLRAKTIAQGITRIVGTRYAIALNAALAAGVPLAEIKRDLLLSWTADERARVGE
jgi:MoxR-like ATPase